MEDTFSLMDMAPRITRRALMITAACAAAACGDRMLTEPRAAASNGATLAQSAAGDVVQMLKRTDRLEHSLTTSAVIGPRGGRLQLGRAGVRVDFAPGAVTTPTRITMTAIRGRNVAYRFEPHGLVFQAPVTVTQSLHNTVAWRNPELAAQLQGSYFERLMVDRTESFSRSGERRAAWLREAGRALEFTIEHFSGYMVSTGKMPVDVSLEFELTLH